MRWTAVTLAVMMTGAMMAQETSADFTKNADIPYAQMDGVDAERLSLDLYAPEEAEGAPIMLYVHGGG
ncbi:MAG: hypothetical protein ACLFU7_14300, partial [Armatimonadota bacterium]